MFVNKIWPRFSETDALGHVNNTSLPVWFEESRTPLFKIFVPDLAPKNWNLILAKIDVEFVRELFYGEEVEVRSYLERIGNSSFVVLQEAWQSGELCARGRATLVHFNHLSKKSEPLPDHIRDALSGHMPPANV